MIYIGANKKFINFTLAKLCRRLLLACLLVVAASRNSNSNNNKRASYEEKLNYVELSVTNSRSNTRYACAMMTDGSTKLRKKESKLFMENANKQN